MILEVLVASFLGFIAVLLGGRYIIPILAQSGFLTQDINKRSRPLIPSGGGILASFGYFVGVIALLFAFSYVVGAAVNITLLLVTLVVVSAISFIGFLDDLLGSRIRTSKASIGKIVKNYTMFSNGIKQWQKPLLTLIAALPLMAINFGASTINLPILGSLPFGQLLYSLIVIPLAVAFSANAFNMLEGLNGIAAQMGLVAVLALAIFSYHTGQFTAFGAASIMSGVLLAYLYYGSYPAKLMPGDSLTYFIGAGFASIVIIGNMFVLGLILIIPWIIEFLLKARVRFHAHSWGVLQSDGTLRSPHGSKIYSLTHLFLRTGKFKEWQIVACLTMLEAVIAIAALAFFW